MKLKKQISDTLLIILILLAVLFGGVILLYIINSLTLGQFRGLLIIDTLLIVLISLVLVKY